MARQGKRASKRSARQQRTAYIIISTMIMCIIAFLCLMFLYWRNTHSTTQSYEDTKKILQQNEERRRKKQEMQREENRARNLPAEADTEQAEQKATEVDTEEEEDNYIHNLDAYEPGDIVDKEEIDSDNLMQYFTSSEISDTVFSRMKGLSYKSYCTVPREDLRYLKVLHYNFDHELQVGELVINARLEKDMLEIFRELYDVGYEIEKMYLVDNYDADDTTSIDYNNTSCFNFRRITNGDKLSNHASGCAIDINPQQNPYVTFHSDGSKSWTHSNADPYIDREGDGDHMINHSDDCYLIFNRHGFTWGGDWNNPKDYQHFEKEVVRYD